jgi:hypothetical protein
MTVGILSESEVCTVSEFVTGALLLGLLYLFFLFL